VDVCFCHNQRNGKQDITLDQYGLIRIINLLLCQKTMRQVHMDQWTTICEQHEKSFTLFETPRPIGIG